LISGKSQLYETFSLNAYIFWAVSFSFYALLIGREIFQKNNGGNFIMGYSISHWNPYEKITKESFLQYLSYIDKQVGEYEKNEKFAKHIVPEKIREKIIS